MTAHGTSGPPTSSPHERAANTTARPKNPVPVARSPLIQTGGPGEGVSAIHSAANA